MVNVTTRMFFTTTAVRRAVDKGTRAVLSKAGAFVRQRARSLIRPRKRSARPGEPPSSHLGLLRRFIYFGYDQGKKSVVIGPAKLNQRNPYGDTTVPEVLEVGGTVTPGSGKHKETRRYRGNPYMGPALEAEKSKFPTLWRNSVKRS